MSEVKFDTVGFFTSLDRLRTERKLPWRKVAARRIVRTEMPMAAAIEKYGVSVALMQMRLQVTGARRSA